MATILPRSYFSESRPFADKKAKENPLSRIWGVCAPSHIAVIMDGNRRYAGKHGIATRFGHRMGTKTTSRVIEWAYKAGIRHLTVYAFSTENFNRKDEEINSIFSLLAEKLDEMIHDKKTMERGLCIRMIGNASLLPDNIVASMRELEEKTKENNSMYVNIALAYGGRQDLVCACRKILKSSDMQTRLQSSASADEMKKAIEKNLSPSPECGNPIPDVDLVIRTGGEQRTSNFLSWQANGNRAVFYASEKMWPEFGLLDFKKAIFAYSVAKRADDRRRKERMQILMKLPEIQKNSDTGR